MPFSFWFDLLSKVYAIIVAQKNKLSSQKLKIFVGDKK